MSIQTTAYWRNQARKDAKGNLICPMEGCTHPPEKLYNNRVFGLHMRQVHKVPSDRANTEVVAKSLHKKEKATIKNITNRIESRNVKCCPNCGYNISLVEEAIEILKGGGKI